MKKFYSIMGAGLLGGLFAFTSCSEEVIVNEAPGGAEEALTDYIVEASIKQAEVLGRANMQGGVYVWNTEDMFTLWNRNKGKGYNFTIDASYDGSQPAAVADFSGKAFWEEGHKLVAVYPAKEASSFADFSTISMPDTCKQATSVAALTEHTYMVASGTVKNGKVEALEFSPLTGLIQFKLKSISDKDLKIRYITLESDEAVFPGILKVEEDGTVSALEGMRNHLTVDMGETVLPKNGEISAYLNVLPTTYGDTRLINASTLLTIKAKVLNGKDEQELTLLKAVPAKDLILEGGVDEDAVDYTGENMEKTAYQLAAGKHYKFNLSVDYRFYIPKTGYQVDEINKEIAIYNVTGLRNWIADVDNYTRYNVKLEIPVAGSAVGETFAAKEIDFANGDPSSSGANWISVGGLTGTFDGNGFVFKNLKIDKDGLFANNNGILKNLTLDGVTILNLGNRTGALVASNSGTIENCHVKNVTMNGINGSGEYGLLVGVNNSGTAIIEDCSVEGGSLQCTANGKAPILGGLCGKNVGVIMHSQVQGAVSVEFKGSNTGGNTVTIGGFVGHQEKGTITACYTSAEVYAEVPANLGGLVGTNASGHIRASYAIGSICVKYINGNWQASGGLVGFNNYGKVVGCYATSVIDPQTTASTNVGGFYGKFPGGGFEQCYFTDSSHKQETTGVQFINSSSELQNEVTLRSINLALERADANLKYNFKVNTDATTKEKQPLILQKAVRVPGAEGPDYGDGGDIM